MSGTPREPTVLADYLERSARRFPERPAVVMPSGASLTYRELNERAGRVAAFLASRGVNRGDRVGVVLPKSLDGVAAIFGILKTGAAYVPADYSAPAERNRSILSDCAVALAFLDPGCTACLHDWPNETLPEVVVVPREDGPPPAESTESSDWKDVLSTDPALAATSRQPAEDLAYVLYTSGSTGIPKGVMLTHRNAMSFVDWCSEVLHPTEKDRFSSHAPFHFDLSVLDIYLAIKHGAALHLVTEELGRQPKELAEFIERARLTVWYSTPSILSVLTQFGDLPQRDLSSLRLVLFAGEVFPAKHLRATKRELPRPVFYNLYGPTETNVCTFARIPDVVPDDRTTPYPIGWPCSHCEALVLDEPGGAEVTKGEEGLLYIRGPSVFQGYWNRPVENDAAFLERGGGRWYNTGDVVREDPADGFIYLGRRDRMVKRRGYRIELGEIERTLYHHPQVREAAVVSLNLESETQIVAFVVLQPGERASIIQMKAFCARHLPAYMNLDVFKFLEALPRTSTNKVDYQELLRSVEAAPPGVLP